MNRFKFRAPLWPFALLWAVFFWPLLTLRSGFILHDYMEQHLPWAWTVFCAVRQGQIPFWTPLMGGGFPLFAEGQAAALYLPHWLAYKTLPFLTAYSWSVPFHFAVAGIGMFYYGRRVGLSSAAAGWTATCFAFGSGYAGCFYNTGSLRTACWIPVVLWILEGVRHRSIHRSLLGFSAVTLIVSQQWTAGFSQIAVYTFGYYLIHEGIAVWENHKRIKGWEAWTGLCGLVVALALGTWMALSQIAPSMELISHSVRQGEGASFALWGSVPPVAPFLLMFPEWGNALRYCFYIGVAPLFFVLSLAVLKRSRPSVRHVWLAALFFLLAVGRFNPLYAWAVEHLHLTMLRNPAKFLFFSVTSLSVLAGFGLDAVLQARANGSLSAHLKKFVVGLGVLVALMPAIGQVALALLKPLWPAYSHWYVQRILDEKGGAAKEPAHYADLMKRFMEGLSHLFSYQNPQNLQVIGLALVTAALTWFFLAGRLKKRFFVTAMTAVLVWDFFIFAHFLGTGFIGNVGPLKDLQETPWRAAVRAEMVKDADTAPGSIVELVDDPAERTFPPNFQMYYGLAHAGGYSPLLIKKYHELVYDLGISDGSLGMPPVSESVWRRERSILNLIGARYWISDRKLEWEGLRALQSDGGGHSFYINELAMPLMWVVGHWDVIPDQGRRLEHMKTGDFDPRAAAVVETAIPDADVSGLRSESEVLQVTEIPSGGRVEAQVRGPGLCVTRITDYPGWRLRVDGSDQALIRVNHAFMGFGLGAGTHRIILEYLPSHWALWVGGSLTGWAVWGLACIAGAVLRLGVRGRQPRSFKS